MARTRGCRCSSGPGGRHAQRCGAHDRSLSGHLSGDRGRVRSGAQHDGCHRRHRARQRWSGDDIGCVRGAARRFARREDRADRSRHVRRSPIKVKNAQNAGASSRDRCEQSGRRHPFDGRHRRHHHHWVGVRGAGATAQTLRSVTASTRRSSSPTCNRCRSTATSTPTSCITSTDTD